MEKVYIFCDEFGTSTLQRKDIKNITKFVYCSVVVKETQIERARQVRNYLSKTFFKGGKVKSKNLLDDTKRVQCLQYLNENLNFITHFLLVDKEKLNQQDGGLRFKNIFYKYFQKIFFGELIHHFTDFEIYMHHSISKEYGEDVKRYLSEKVRHNLFEKYHFLDDTNEPLIQFADLYAGSFGRCFNLDFYSELNSSVLEAIRPRILSINYFPEQYAADNFNQEASTVSVVEEIFSIVHGDAQVALKEVDDDIQKCFLDQLLSYQKTLPNYYLQTFEIQNYVKHFTNKDISVDQLRLVVRDLRFKGIIIVSSKNNSGYKLAVNREDIFQYFDHYSKYIIPMLRKIQIANDVFMTKTVGEFVPLNNFEELTRLVEEIKVKGLS